MAYLLPVTFNANFGGLCDLYPRIKGVFNGLTDTFDPARHRIDVGASPGIRVRKTVRENATVTKDETIKPAPAPLEYVDLASGEINSTITSGTIGTINGHRLKFDDAQADEGIFLISTTDPAAEVRISAVQRNKPGQLVFLVPSISPITTYYMEVRARFGTDLRIGRLDAVLTV